MKEIVVYTLMKTHRGYIPSDIALGRIMLDGNGGFDVDCPSGSFRELLISIFGVPKITVREPADDSFGCRYKTMSPSSPGFFEELLFRLRKYNLWGRANG